MFYDYLKSQRQKLALLKDKIYRESDVRRALACERLDPHDLMALLSPSALPLLEEMAQKARQLTARNFGRTISLFAPLYLANYCANSCLYCSFNCRNSIDRRKLTLQEVELEGQAVADTGLGHLLLLTGESRQHSGPGYIQACVERLRPYFASLGIEVYPLAEEEYEHLYEGGVDSLTLFQETYDEKVYASVHPAGPKRDYRWRLDAPERACRAGIPGVNIGALLGLGEWREDAWATALHAQYLQKNYPDVEIALSVPRLRPHVGGFQPQASPVTDVALVQIILAYRLYLPRAGITLSTRESPHLRESLLPLGVTRMSAGSLTSVGGYASTAGSTQFEIADERSVPEIASMLSRSGYQPVYRDWINLKGIEGSVGR